MSHTAEPSVDATSVQGTRVAAVVLVASAGVLAYAMAEMRMTPTADWAGPTATTLMSLVWLFSAVVPVGVGAASAVAPHHPLAQQGVALAATMAPFLFLVMLSGVLAAGAADAEWTDAEVGGSQWYLAGAGGLVVAAAVCILTRLRWFSRAGTSTAGWLLWGVTVLTFALGAGVQIVIAYAAADQGDAALPMWWTVAALISVAILSVCLMMVAFHPVPGARRAGAFWCGGVLVMATIVWSVLFAQASGYLLLIALPVMLAAASLPFGAGVMLGRDGRLSPPSTSPVGV